MNRFRYRQLFLFLAVLILPSVAIVVLSRGLDKAARKEADVQLERWFAREAERMASEIHSAMYDRLQLLASSLAGGADMQSEPAVVLVGWADGERVVWPWQPEKVAPIEPAFLKKIREADRMALADKDEAANLFRALIDQAGDERQRALARLGLARTLASDGQQEEARKVYLEVLNLPWRIADEDGYSIASYAASTLASTAASREVLDRVKQELDSPNFLSLGQSYRLKLILEALRKSEDHSVRDSAEGLFRRVSMRIKALEAGKQMKEAETLQEDFSGLSVSATQWWPYPGTGNELWLVGKSPGRHGSPSLIVVARAETIRADVESERLSRAAGPKFQVVTEGWENLLGEHLPGLGLVFQAPTIEQAAAINQAPIYLESGDGVVVSMELENTVPSVPVTRVWILIIVPLTFLGGYLLWRDTRREIRLADMRSQFVSSVSHELKTPLTAIRMFAETLQISGSTDARTHDEYLETIVNESERLTRLLNNVLDFSRIERGQKSYVMEPTSLEDVVQAAARMMQYPLSEKGFVLNVSIRDGIPPVNADRDAIQQAILNLLTNAMKYSGKHRDIELQLFSENGCALIRVTDHGVGIPESEQVRIFEKFYRAPVPENRAIAGTGLGLALVAHVAEAHCGSVQVRSNPGEGSTFSIRLPLAGKDSSAA